MLSILPTNSVRKLTYFKFDLVLSCLLLMVISFQASSADLEVGAMESIVITKIPY